MAPNKVKKPSLRDWASWFASSRDAGDVAGDSERGLGV